MVWRRLKSGALRFYVNQNEARVVSLIYAIQRTVANLFLYQSAEHCLSVIN